MDFEFHPAKSVANQAKHGIDFVEAQAGAVGGFQSRRRAALAGPEPRYVAIGRIRGQMWTAIFTWRDDRLRIISVRRSRPNEVKRYEEN